MKNIQLFENFSDLSRLKQMMELGRSIYVTTKDNEELIKELASKYDYKFYILNKTTPRDTVEFIDLKLQMSQQLKNNSHSHELIVVIAKGNDINREYADRLINLCNTILNVEIFTNNKNIIDANDKTGVFEGLKNFKAFESLVNRKKDEEIFNYNQLVRDEWRKIIKNAQEFQKIFFDLENNDTLKEKKAIIINKNLRKDQPIKYEVNAELCYAGGDWEIPVMYFKIELTSDYGLLDAKYHKTPQYIWDLDIQSDDKRYSKLTRCFVMIPPVEAGNKLAKIDKGLTAQESNSGNSGRITDEMKKKAWAWLEKTITKAIEDRHEMLNKTDVQIEKETEEPQPISEASGSYKPAADTDNINLKRKSVSFDSFVGNLEAGNLLLVYEEDLNKIELISKIALEKNYTVFDFINRKINMKDDKNFDKKVDIQTEEFRSNVNAKRVLTIIDVKGSFTLPANFKNPFFRFAVDIPVASKKLLDVNSKIGLFDQ